ncbi:MAG: GAF domain-containing sensor histidine kinase [Actinomycetota bacterium]
MTKRPELDRTRALIEAGLALSAALDLETVLQRIVELGLEVTQARYCALGVIGTDGMIERFITSGMSEEVRERIGAPPTGHGILGILTAEGEPIRLPDIGADPRSYGFPPNHPPMTSFLGVPVRARGRVYGNLYFTEKLDAEAFDETDEEIASVLATQAGVAIENARLYEEATHAQSELRRLEVLDERERIAKELHDGVIQSLFAVGMGLQGAAAITGDEVMSLRIESAVDELDNAIRDLRNYIFGLRPGILADRQLGQALKQLATEFSQNSDVLIVADIDERLASELASMASDVVQLVREALSNVVRHSRASTCRVTLRRDAGVAVLEIDDDGTGFDPHAPAAGMGMANLRARAAALGGRLEVSSSSQEGTTVQAIVPG